MTFAALVLLALALPAQLVAAAGYGLRPSDGWDGALGATSLGVAAASVVLALTYAGAAPDPSACAPLSPGGATRVALATAGALLLLAALGVTAMRSRRGPTIALALLGEIVAAALAAGLAVWLAGGTSC